MLATGRHNDKFLPNKGHIPLILTVMDEPVAVRRDEIKGLVNDRIFQDALSIYQLTKLWGSPNGNGWANEPIEVLEAITAIELEARALEHEELENARNNGNNAQPSDPKKALRTAGSKK